MFKEWSWLQRPVVSRACGRNGPARPVGTAAGSLTEHQSIQARQSRPASTGTGQSLVNTAHSLTHPLTHSLTHNNTRRPPQSVYTSCCWLLLLGGAAYCCRGCCLLLQGVLLTAARGAGCCCWGMLLAATGGAACCPWEVLLLGAAAAAATGRMAPYGSSGAVSGVAMM